MGRKTTPVHKSSMHLQHHGRGAHCGSPRHERAATDLVAGQRTGTHPNPNLPASRAKKARRYATRHARRQEGPQARHNAKPNNAKLKVGDALDHAWNWHSYQPYGGPSVKPRARENPSHEQYDQPADPFCTLYIWLSSERSCKQALPQPPHALQLKVSAVVGQPAGHP